VLFPLVMWAALRFRTRGAALALLLIGCIATWGTLSGTGPFSTGDLTVDMSRMQLFVGVLSGTGLMLAAVVAEREAGASRLAASESRLRAIVEQSRDGISIGSPDGTVLVYNAAMERISGFTQQEVDERGWFDCVYPDDGLREEALRLAAQAVEGEAPYLELPIKRKDGVVRWVSFSTTPIVLEGRTYNLSIIGDVTERRAAETRLRDLDSIIRRSQAVAFRWSREEGWPIEFVSDNVAHWGYDAGDLTGVSYMRLLHPDDVSRIAAEVEANLLEGHAEFTEEYRIVTKDGRTRWVEDSTWVLPGEEHVLGVVVDVTERRELELERTMLHDVVERSLNEVYVFDVDTLRFGYVNEAAAENLGYPRERLLELTPVDLKPEFDRESFASLIEPLKAGTTDNVVLETIHQRADGSTYPVEVRLQIADTAHGRVFVAIINDITARKAAEAAAEDYREHLEALVAERTASLEDANEELQAVNEELAAANEELAVNNEELAHSSAEIMRMNAELQEATRAKSDFLAAMSHELRTPLNSILAFSEILLEGMAGPLNEEQSKQLSMINSSGKHLLELINDVLDLSRIEAGRMPLTVGEFELREEIEPLVRGLSAQAAEKDLTLVAEYPPEPVLMRTDARKVRQILLNLLSNAVKFTDRGQVRMTVSTTKEGASIVVSDTRPGIAEADQPALFEPFTQASTTVAGKPEGTGLGLAISARLAETLGGTLVVASRPGEGAVFTLEIPQRLTLE